MIITSLVNNKNRAFELQQKREGRNITEIETKTFWKVTLYEYTRDFSQEHMNCRTNYIKGNVFVFSIWFC